MVLEDSYSSGLCYDGVVFRIYGMFLSEGDIFEIKRKEGSVFFYSLHFELCNVRY